MIERYWFDPDGASLWAVKKVNATTVGSKSERRTSIVLGLPCTSFELEQVQRELKQLEIEHERLEYGVAYAETEIQFGKEMVRLQREERQCIVKMVCGEIVVM